MTTYTPAPTAQAGGPPASGPSTLEVAPPGRMRALDALRGFNMLWLIGGAELLLAVAARVDNPTLSALVYNAASHAEWEGFHAYDLIFPMFLFITGVTIPMITARRLAAGEPPARQTVRIARRVMLLFGLGLVYNGLLHLAPGELRIMGVLQRLALGYGAAALLVLYTTRRTQVMVCLSLLLGYWMLLQFAPVPGCGAGMITPDCNVVNYIDRLVFSPAQMFERYGDPEGLLSTLPAIATALLGVITGQWMMMTKDPSKRVKTLFAAGASGVAAGYLWGQVFPVIKKLWTSSYVIEAAGWSLLLLAVFVWIVDVRGWNRSMTFFVVIGVNPLVIYLAQEVVNFDGIGGYFTGGLGEAFPFWAPVIAAAAVLAAKWLVLFFLDRKKIHLRV